MADARTTVAHARSTAAHAERKPDKIHALTSLRFFAALCVVLYHTAMPAFPSVTEGSLTGRIIALGYIPVSFFFILSGYILAMVYLSKGRPVRRKSFFVARFARIYPLFLLMLIVDSHTLILHRLASYGLKSTILKMSVTYVGNLLMLHAWIPSLKGINNPSWSLSAETFFYLLFPFIGAWLWRLKGSRIYVFGFSIWAINQIIVYLLLPHLEIEVLRTSPLLNLSTFVLGILLARWQCLRRERTDTPPIQGWGTALVFVLFLSTYAAVLYFFDHIAIPTLADGLLAPIFLPMILIFSHNDGLPARMLSAPWLVVLGEASFGLYVIHIPIYRAVEHLHLQSSSAFYPVFLAICVGFSVLSFYFFETPARKWILKRFQTRPKETMEAASDAQ